MNSEPAPAPSAWVNKKKKKTKVVKRELDERERRACALANFPEKLALKAHASFWRRVMMAKAEEVDVLLDDRLWSDKAGTVHERLYVATWLWLFFAEESDTRKRLEGLIGRLAWRYVWHHIPVVRMIDKSTAESTTPTVPQPSPSADGEGWN